MRSFAPWRFAALALFAPLAAGPAAAADFAGLRAWVGKYPSQPIDGQRFFTYPGLRPAMRRALGPRAWAHVKLIRGPEVPVVAVRGWVVAYRCQAHDCGDVNMAVAVRVARGLVLVCWRDAPAQPDAHWYRAGRRPRRDRGHGCPGDAAETRAALRRIGY